MRFLSQCIGLPVRDPSGEPIGTIADLIVAIGGTYPPVTGLVARTGRRRIFLPWRDVAGLEDDGARLRVRTIDIAQVPPAPQRDPAAGRPAGQADRRPRGPQGHPRQRRLASTTSGDAPGGGRGRRRGRAAAPAGRRGRLPHHRPRPCGSRSRSATSTGRTSTRSTPPSPASSSASRTRSWPSCTRRTSPSILEDLAPRDRAGVLASLDDESLADAVEEMDPEAQVDLLEDLSPRARGGHPRGDEP